MARRDPTALLRRTAANVPGKRDLVSQSDSQSSSQAVSQSVNPLPPCQCFQMCALIVETDLVPYPKWRGLPQMEMTVLHRYA